MKYSREEFEARLSAYLDNQVTDSERADIESHLQRDAAARALLADLQAMRAGLQALPRARASADMMESIRARMERQALLGDTPRSGERAQRGISLAARWAAAAVIVIMASVGGYIIWTMNSPAVGPNQQLAMLDQKTGMEDDAETVNGPQLTSPASPEPASTPITLADAAEPEATMPLYSYGRSAPPVAAPAAPGLAGDEEQGRAGTTLEGRTPEASYTLGDETSAGESTAPSRSAQRAAEPAGGRSSPVWAARRGRPRSGDARDDYASDTDWLLARRRDTGRVVTLNFDSIESKRELIGSVSARAVSVSPLHVDAPERGYFATIVPNRESMDYGVATMPGSQSRPATAQAKPRSITMKVGVPAARANDASKVTASDAVDDQITDLLVVVADEKARDEMLRHLEGETQYADRGGDEDQDGASYFGGYRRPTAGAAVLPSDSIVHGARAEQKEVVQTAPVAATEAPAETTAIRMAPPPPPVQEDEARERLAPNLPARAAEAASRPIGSEDVAAAQGSFGGRYLLRFHIISAQSAHTRPGDDAELDWPQPPASTPADEIKYDPSVLDLRKPPKQNASATRPATQPE